MCIRDRFIGRHFVPDKQAGAMDEEAVKAAAEEAGASGDGAPKSKKMCIRDRNIPLTRCGSFLFRLLLFVSIIA